MIPWFQWTTIALGPVTIYVWGLFVSLGIVLACVILSRRSKPLGFASDDLLNHALWMIALGLLSARLFHVLFYAPGYYALHPLGVIKIWQGGMSIIGGVLGAAFGFFLYAAKHKISREKLLARADALSFAALFGFLVGRVGCFLIHDHPGIHSTCPLAIRFPDGPRLDMAMIEILVLLPLAVVFFVMRKKTPRPGFYTGLLVAYYGLARFFLDFLRATDVPGADARYFGLTPAQYLGIILVLVGVFLLRKKK